MFVDNYVCVIMPMIVLYIFLYYVYRKVKGNLTAKVLFKIILNINAFVKNTICQVQTLL